MKRKTASGSTTAAGRMEQLRQQAEKIVQKKARTVPESMDALSPADAKRMLHDLHVQQIEREAHAGTLGLPRQRLPRAGRGA